MNAEVFNFYALDRDDDGKPRERYEMPRGPDVDLQIVEIEIETPLERQRREDEEAVIRGGVLKDLNNIRSRTPLWKHDQFIPE